MRADIDVAKERIIQQLQEGVPQSVICSEFHCKPETLKRRLKLWGIEHINNKPGRGRPKPWKRRSASQYLTRNAFTNVHRLKLKLWRDNIKPMYCEECGWARQATNGRLPLELHHVNGDKTDNWLDNLVVLCPNCHSLKDNHRGLSKGRRKGSLSVNPE